MIFEAVTIFNFSVFDPRGVKRTRNALDTSNDDTSPAKKVSKLAMEWTEEDEDDTAQTS